MIPTVHPSAPIYCHVQLPISMLVIIAKQSISFIRDE